MSAIAMYTYNKSIGNPNTVPATHSG
jgi:hypothetical protein